MVVQHKGTTLTQLAQAGATKGPRDEAHKHAAGGSTLPEQQPEFDAVVCGGTLGVLVALALQLKGHRVAVVERRRVVGRTQARVTSKASAGHLTLLLDDCLLAPVHVLLAATLVYWAEPHHVAHHVSSLPPSTHTHHHHHTLTMSHYPCHTVTH